MYSVEHRELTEQRTHGAAMSNVFHCNLPPQHIHSISTAYPQHIHSISAPYCESCVRVIMIMRKNYFGCAGNVSNFPRQITETAQAHVSGNKAEQAYRRSDGLNSDRRLIEL